MATTTSPSKNKRSLDEYFGSSSSKKQKVTKVKQLKKKETPERRVKDKEILQDDLEVKKTSKKTKETKDNKEEEEKSLFTFHVSPPLKMIETDEKSSLAWCPTYLTKAQSDALFDHCMKVLNYEQSSFKMFGKPVMVPRLQSWFADEDLVVKDLFQKQKQHPWTPMMRALKNQLEKQLGCEFMYCLVNLYRDGKDHITYHADREVKGTVASVSLGVTRKFFLRHKSEFKGKKNEEKKYPEVKDKLKYEFQLVHGSMVAMLGETQKHWKHRVPEDSKVTTKRINLTFRTW